MAIISVNKKSAFRGYGNTQFRYAMTYVAVTFMVLLFLNIYCAKTSQRVFYMGKESAMLEKCHFASSEIAKLDVLNPSTISGAISQMDSMKVTRLIITDQTGLALYDSSQSALGTYVLFPEIIQAMDGGGNNVFNWQFRNGIIDSRAAAPIV